MIPLHPNADGYDPMEDGDGPAVHECDHEDYDLDILIGRATCNMCDHHWYMSVAEFDRHQRRCAAPYPEPEDEQ